MSVCFFTQSDDSGPRITAKSTVASQYEYRRFAGLFMVWQAIDGSHVRTNPLARRTQLRGCAEE